MKIVEIRIADKPGNIKAFLKVETDDGLTIEGFKVMDGRNGLFVSPPSKKVGEKFIDTVTMTKDARTILTDLALDRYQEMMDKRGE